MGAPDVSPVPVWRRYFRFLGPDARADVGEEFAFHLEMRTKELIDAGFDHEAARLEALRQFGDVHRLESEIVTMHDRYARAKHWSQSVEALGSVMRHALRRAARAPGSSTIVVLTFALGIGANAIMFGIVDRLLLRAPAHVQRPAEVSRLVIERTQGSGGAREASSVMTYPDFLDFAPAKSTTIAAFSRTELTLGQGMDAREVNAVLASGNYFRLLGVRPELGRLFGSSDDRVDSDRVAVISFALWRNAYGGDPQVVHKTLDFGHGPFTVIGVAPSGFNGIGLRPVDVWLPLLPAGTLIDGPRWVTDRGWQSLEVLGRRAAGASPEQVAAEATLLHRRGRAQDIAQSQYDAQAIVVGRPLIAATQDDGSRAAPALVAAWLLGVSGLLLLIACANIANILLSRAIRDRREVGIRLALGGSRRRVLGQALADALVLSVAGGLTAVLVSHWGGRIARDFLLPGVFWPDDAAGVRVLTFVVLLAVLAGTAAGLLPAIQASRGGIDAVLKSAGSRTQSARSRARNVLTVLQTVVSVVLLVGAGLFVRSLQQVQALNIGLDPRGVLVATPTFDRGFTSTRRSDFYRQAAERLRALPGVQQVSPDISVPFWNRRSYGLRVPGLDSVPRVPSAMHLVDGAYFALLRMRIVRGRTFQDGDAHAIVINETMARALWSGQEPIGKCVFVIQDPKAEPPCSEVIGVVENARVRGLVEGQTMNYYLPTTQTSVNAAPVALLARVTGDPARSIATLRTAMLDVDQSVRYVKVVAMQDIIDPQMRSWRLGAIVFTLFGTLALFVSMLGMYGVLAFSVAQRRFELGIRAALGAAPGALVGMVFGQAVRLVAVGIGLGLVIAFVAAGRMQSLLFQVSPRDPVVVGVVVSSLLFAAVLAAWIPSRRATRVDPASALRAE